MYMINSLRDTTFGFNEVSILFCKIASDYSFRYFTAYRYCYKWLLSRYDISDSDQRVPVFLVRAFCCKIPDDICPLISSVNYIYFSNSMKWDNSRLHNLSFYNLFCTQMTAYVRLGRIPDLVQDY